MPLDPRVRRIVALATRLDRRGDDALFAERRAAEAAVAARLGGLVMPKGPEPARQHDVEVPVTGGRIRLRLYEAHGPGPHPLYVFLHGGGWCVGTIDERDPRCRAIAAGAACTVASVDYRLAPENQFPTPVDDCEAALRWLVDHAEDLGIDPARVAIGGESAGGNLAAVVARRARDAGGPALCHQWLDVPAVDLTLAQPAFTEVPDGYLLDRADIVRFLEAYLPEPTLDRDPDASPLHAESLAGLPPAWIMSAEFDKLRDDGRAYAEALEAAGVPVRFQILPGHVHPSFAFTRLIPSSAAYEREAIAALAAAFARAANPAA